MKRREADNLRRNILPGMRPLSACSILKNWLRLWSTAEPPEKHLGNDLMLSIAHLYSLAENPEFSQSFCLVLTFNDE